MPFCQAEMQELSTINNQHLDMQWIMFSSQSIKKLKSLQQNTTTKWREYQMVYRP